MKRSTQTRVAVAAVVLAAAIGTHAGRASACSNEVAYTVSPAIRQIAESERLLRGGKIAKAALGLTKTIRGLRADARLPQHPLGGIDRTAARAQRLVAVSVVRSEGLLDLGSAFPSSTASDRRANLTWATDILRAFARLDTSPSVQTDLGEALSKLPETRVEAFRTLDALAKNDLITSPEGYAALAELRLASGDRKGHDEARARFEKMAPSRRAPGGHG